MTSTNKRKLAVLAVWLPLLACILTGCDTKEYTFTYDPNSPISSFQVTESMTVQQADLFAEDL